MKRKFLCAVVAMSCITGMLTAVPASAATTNLDFENVSALTDIKGSDKFFTTSSNVIDTTAEFETETIGTYTNKYLSVKYQANNSTFVSQPILDNDVTVVSARLKFYSGSQAGLIIRTGSNQYLAVNNSGGTSLRLLNNASYALTGYENKWVDVRYVIEKTSATTANITGYMMLTGQPDTMLTCSLNNFAINANTHLRFQTDGGSKSSIDNLVVKSYSASEAVELVKEDFEQFAEGIQATKNSALSGNSLMQTNAANSVTVTVENDNNYMKLTDSSAVLHNFKVPTKTKSVLSFDMKTSTADGNKVFLRPTAGGEYKLVSYDANGQAVVMDYAINGLASTLMSEFVHFDFVIDTNGTATTVNGYVNGQWITEKSWTNLIFGDLRAQAAAGSEICLDNITVSIPGTASMTAEAGDVATNEAVVTITSNNVIDPATITASIDGTAQEITKSMSNDGKTYALTLTKLNADTEYNVVVSASDYFGQEMAAQTVTLKTAEEPETIPTVTVAELGRFTDEGSNPAISYTGTFELNSVPVAGVKWTVADKSASLELGEAMSGEGTVVVGLIVEIASTTIDEYKAVPSAECIAAE